MKRPMEINWFERIILATLVLGVFNSWLNWPQLSAKLGNPALLIIAQLVTAAIILSLTLLTSRRRSNVAKWISIGMFVLGLPLWLRQVAGGLPTGSMIISWTQVVLQVVAFALLFTAASRRWFKSKRT